jgi:hypothetical protein
MRNAASVERLMQIKDVTEEDAALIRAIWKARTRDQVYALYPKAEQWNAESLDRTKQESINAAIRAMGVEYLGRWKRTGETIEYCNAADTYATTIVFVGDKLRVGCMGYYVEKGIDREIDPYL